LSYEKIDRILSEIAPRWGVTVMAGDTHPHRRFFHVSSASETFQIVVEPETNGTVRLDMHLIESDASEMDLKWEGPVDHLAQVLNFVKRTISNWFEIAAR
jgi:hypothetical protein